MHDKNDSILHFFQNQRFQQSSQNYDQIQDAVNYENRWYNRGALASLTAPSKCDDGNKRACYQNMEQSLPVKMFIN